MTSATQKPGKLPGTRPEGARDEREAAAQVREMFTRISPRYDFLNHFLSLSLDRVWRRSTAKKFLPILRNLDARALDLCCGTGDLAFAIDLERENAMCYAA
ncbi:MAG: class I SAM-dependent methyltransferase, partial [Candidatus Acidiferrales bacterium]